MNADTLLERLSERDALAASWFLGARVATPDEILKMRRKRNPLSKELRGPRRDR